MSTSLHRLLRRLSEDQAEKNLQAWKQSSNNGDIGGTENAMC